MIASEAAHRLAVQWVADWNAHDLDAILAHYADELEFASPLIVERLRRADGTIRSKRELREYFAVGIAPGSDLRFEPIDLLIGVGSIVLYYRNQRGRVVAETMFLDAGQKVVKAAVHWA